MTFASRCITVGFDNPHRTSVGDLTLCQEGGETFEDFQSRCQCGGGVWNPESGPYAECEGGEATGNEFVELSKNNKRERGSLGSSDSQQGKQDV